MRLVAEENARLKMDRTEEELELEVVRLRKDMATGNKTLVRNKWRLSAVTRQLQQLSDDHDPVRARSVQLRAECEASELRQFVDVRLYCTCVC